MAGVGVIVLVPRGDHQPAGTSTSSSVTPAAQEAWLTHPVRGSSWKGADFHPVTFSQADGGAYSFYMPQTYELRCGVYFSPTGTPSNLIDCTSDHAGSQVTPFSIAVSCNVRQADELCTADYEYDGTAETLMFSRALDRDAQWPW